MTTHAACGDPGCLEHGARAMTTERPTTEAALRRLAATWDAKAISAGTYSMHTLRRCARDLRAALPAEPTAPTLDGAAIGRAWFEDWSGERWPADLSESSQRLWQERGIRVAARLAAEPDGEHR